MTVQSSDRGGAALNALRIGARFCDQKLGWNRIGFLLSLTIIAVASAALYHTLRGIRVGNATVLGLGIAYVPLAGSAIDQLPACFNRGAALTILLVLAAYIAWVWQRPRVIGLRDWNVILPGGPLTVLQIGIGIVDLAFCAL